MAGPRRPRIRPVKERDPVAVAVVGLLVLALLAALAYHVDRLPLGGGTSYSADFSEAAGLDAGDEVRIAGVKAGRVTGVGLDGAKVKVTFEVEDAGSATGRPPPSPSRPSSATSTWHSTRSAPPGRTPAAASRCPAPPPPTT
ncbi:hypothetical protein SHIRM173S_07373 [Streptomyces hirsutus]